MLSEASSPYGPQNTGLELQAYIQPWLASSNSLLSGPSYKVGLGTIVLVASQIEAHATTYRGDLPRRIDADPPDL